MTLVLSNEYKLIQQGRRVSNGTRHWIVEYQGKRTTIPRHESQEIKTRTYFSILKQLGLK